MTSNRDADGHTEAQRDDLRRFKLGLPSVVQQAERAEIAAWADAEQAERVALRARLSNDA